MKVIDKETGAMFHPASIENRGHGEIFMRNKLGLTIGKIHSSRAIIIFNEKEMADDMPEGQCAIKDSL